MIGHSTHDNSPHLAHQSIQQFNKQPQQMTQNAQNIGLAQLQNQQAMIQRPIQQVGSMQPNA